jgi:hypothetical protein
MRTRFITGVSSRSNHALRESATSTAAAATRTTSCSRRAVGSVNESTSEDELVEDDFSTQVEGVVLNDTGEELSYVEVGVTFYDDEGRRIDDFFTNTTDLADGEEWVFEVMTTADPDDIDDYTIVVTDEAF